MNTEREAFEAWARSQWGDRSIPDNAWLGWQARASAPAPEPEWLHLKAYGYAPGCYMVKCHSCGEIVDGLDKRAITCRTCAEKRHAAAPASSPLGRDADWALAMGQALGPGYFVPIAPSVEAFRELFSRVRAAPAAVGEPLPKTLTDEQIDRIAENCAKAMPDGIRGFCRTWGWRQFARELLDVCAGYERAASPAPDRYEATDAPALSMSMFATSADYEKALRDSVSAVAEPTGASDGARGDGGVEPQGTVEHVCGLQGFGALGDVCPGCTQWNAPVEPQGEPDRAHPGPIVMIDPGAPAPYEPNEDGRLECICEMGSVAAASMCERCPRRPAAVERDLKCWAAVMELRQDEAESVEILADNADFNGQPDRVVICSGAWTDYNDERFGGDTMLQALEAAVAARRART